MTNKEKFDKYVDRICMNIERFYVEHHSRLPEIIFMSYELFCLLSYNNYGIVTYDTADGSIDTFHRVPIKVYNSNKIEYYLAESGGELK